LLSSYRTYLAPVISARDEEGLSSCVTYPCYHAVATTPPDVSFPFQSVSGRHAAFAIRLLARPAGFNHFRGYLCVYFRYGLATCTTCYTGRLLMSFMSFISSAHVI